MSDSRYYGVSTGNGNDGVSHIFPDYYVKTNEPWRLAELAALSEFKAGEGQEWARENMEIDGEADHTISVVFYESKETQDEHADLEEHLALHRAALANFPASGLPEKREELESEIENLESEIDGYGEDSAWFILEVFPEDDMRDGTPKYESLEDAFGLDVVALVAAD